MSELRPDEELDPERMPWGYHQRGLSGQIDWLFHCISELQSERDMLRLKVHDLQQKLKKSKGEYATSYNHFATD